MTLKDMVAGITRTGVTTAVSVVRHPVNIASLAAGMVKGAAETSLDLVRSRIGGPATGDSTVPEQHEAPHSTTDVTEEAAPAAEQPAEQPAEPAAEAPAKKAAAEKAPARKAAAKKAPAKKAAAKKTAAKKAPAKAAQEDPRDRIPGPDLATFEPPRPEDLPEPVVIVADDGAEPGEAFHTEPKAATRGSAHGGPAGDREEVSGYVEEIVTDDLDIETPVGTTGAEVGTNPYTAEADLQQPGTPPVLDPATVKAVESESEILRKASDPDRG
jgi:hypothetical protein